MNVQKPNGFRNYFISTFYQLENIVVLYFYIMYYCYLVPAFMFVMKN